MFSSHFFGLDDIVKSLLVHMICEKACWNDYIFFFIYKLLKCNGWWSLCVCALWSWLQSSIILSVLCNHLVFESWFFSLLFLEFACVFQNHIWCWHWWFWGKTMEISWHWYIRLLQLWLKWKQLERLLQTAGNNQSYSILPIVQGNAITTPIF